MGITRFEHNQQHRHVTALERIADSLERLVEIEDERRQIEKAIVFGEGPVIVLTDQDFAALVRELRK